MSPNIVALLYLVAGILFILALRGLSSPVTSRAGNIYGMIGMSIGAAIGAVTFTGSVIAFLKLDGRMSGKPILLPLRHLINIALAALLIASVYWFVRSESHLAFWLVALLSFLLGVLIIIP